MRKYLICQTKNTSGMIFDDDEIMDVLGDDLLPGDIMRIVSLDIGESLTVDCWTIQRKE